MQSRRLHVSLSVLLRSPDSQKHLWIYFKAAVVSLRPSSSVVFDQFGLFFSSVATRECLSVC